jgi:HSP20 family protein
MADGNGITIKEKTEATEPVHGWDPLATLDELQMEMERRFGGWPLMRGWRPKRPSGLRLFGGQKAWSPSVDVFKRDDKLVVKADLPGMKKDDVSVELQDGDLVIRGTRSAETEVREEDYYRSERSYGAFYRRMPLGGPVTTADIEAKFKDGVLEVLVPLAKLETAPAQRIEVQ